MKRAAGWIGAAAVLLCLAGGARVTLRHARRFFSRPILAATREIADGPATSLTIPPRDPNFLQPQRLDAWRIIGPGGGGTFYSPAISPLDPNLVFAATDMTSCFVSENGGHTWRSFNLRATCRFAFDPKLPNRVYALAGPLWRSDDRGHTWNTIYPEPETIVGYGADEGEEWMYGRIAEDENVPWASARKYYPLGIDAMVVDPDDSNTIYASMDSNLEITHDGGKHWKIATWDDHAYNLWVDPTSPRGKRVIYMARENILATWDGANYVKHPVGGGRALAWAFGTRSDGKPVVYVACEYNEKDGQIVGGIMSSEDGGVTWRSLNENLLKLTLPNKIPVFTSLAVSAKHAEVVYLGFARLVPPSERTQYYYGVLKSSDGGKNWDPVRIEASTPAPNMHNDWTTQRFGPDWAEGPVSMTTDANDPNLVYTGDYGRVMRSVDGGKNWYGVFSQSTGKGYTTTGLDDTTCYGIHIDPFDPKHMFISYTDIGLMASEDGGESWVSATTNGVPFGMRGNSYWVEFDPAVKGKLWTIQSNRHDLPRHRMLNLYGGGTAAVLISVDGGHSWKISNHGLPGAMAPTHILLDPKSPVDARVLYVTLFGLGVYKSTDGGQNWEKKSEGLPAEAPLTWRMALGGDGTLYVVTTRRSEDGKYGNDKDGWLFRSRDGANSWQRVELPPGVNGPMGITVDPKDPQRLYLAAWARYIAGAGGAPPDGGVYLSADGGQHWDNVLNLSRRIYDVTVDPRDTNLVYATGFESSAWRSADRGKTWARIGGYNFKDGHRIIPDPTDINKIYIATFGNSIWHGPATGDPNAVEDIAGPPSLRYQTWKQPPEKM